MIGRHRNGYQYRNKRNSSSTGTRNSIIGTILSAVSGFLIKDLSNEVSP
jgi:hypothetical protein